ncbi:MAG: periplasmic heavy metal sensor [Thermodesulfobacteriota bacterium]
MKRTAFVLAVVVSLATIGLGLADARGPGRGVGGVGGCGGPCVSGAGPGGYAAPDAASQEVRAAFLAETVELRRTLAVKRAELAALMAGDSPDPARAGGLQGEVFDLESQLQQAATDAGLPAWGGGDCPGPGNCGTGPRGGWRQGSTAAPPPAR